MPDPTETLAALIEQSRQRAASWEERLAVSRAQARRDKILRRIAPGVLTIMRAAAKRPEIETEYRTLADSLARAVAETETDHA